MFAWCWCNILQFKIGIQSVLPDPVDIVQETFTEQGLMLMLTFNKINVNYQQTNVIQLQHHGSDAIVCITTPYLYYMIH